TGWPAMLRRRIRASIAGAPNGEHGKQDENRRTGTPGSTSCKGTSDAGAALLATAARGNAELYGARATMPCLSIERLSPLPGGQSMTGRIVGDRIGSYLSNQAR